MIHVDAVIERLIGVLSERLPAALAEVGAIEIPGGATIEEEGEEPRAETYADRLGALVTPRQVVRFTEEVPELSTPSVLVQVEGDVDSTPYWTPHEDLSWPIAVWVVDWPQVGHDLADQTAWCYGEAVRRVLRRYAAGGGGIIHSVRADTMSVEVGQWGEGANGRQTIVRCVAHRWEASAA